MTKCGTIPAVQFAESSNARWDSGGCELGQPPAWLAYSSICKCYAPEQRSGSGFLGHLSQVLWFTGLTSGQNRRCCPGRRLRPPASCVWQGSGWRDLGQALVSPSSLGSPGSTSEALPTSLFTSKVAFLKVPTLPQRHFERIKWICIKRLL